MQIYIDTVPNQHHLFARYYTVSDRRVIVSFTAIHQNKEQELIRMTTNGKYPVCGNALSSSIDLFTVTFQSFKHNNSSCIDFQYECYLISALASSRNISLEDEKNKNVFLLSPCRSEKIMYFPIQCVAKLIKEHKFQG